MRPVDQLASCDGGPCPIVYKTDQEGTVVVQGYKLDAESEENFPTPPEEAVVTIPVDILLKAAEKFKGQKAAV